MWHRTILNSSWLHLVSFNYRFSASYYSTLQVLTFQIKGNIAIEEKSKQWVVRPEWYYFFHYIDCFGGSNNIMHTYHMIWYDMFLCLASDRYVRYLLSHVWRCFWSLMDWAIKYELRIFVSQTFPSTSLIKCLRKNPTLGKGVC